MKDKYYNYALYILLAVSISLNWYFVYKNNSKKITAPSQLDYQTLINNIELKDENGVVHKKGMLDLNDCYIFMFSTNCPNCKDIMPTWGELYGKDKDVKCYGIVIDANYNEISTIKIKDGIKYGIYALSNKQIYDVGIQLPMTIKIKNGLIKKIWLGSEQKIKDNILSDIK